MNLGLYLGCSDQKAVKGYSTFVKINWGFLHLEYSHLVSSTVSCTQAEKQRFLF